VVWLGCRFLLKKDMRAKREMAGEYWEMEFVRLLVSSASPASSSSPSSPSSLWSNVQQEEGKKRTSKCCRLFILYPASTRTEVEKQDGLTCSTAAEVLSDTILPKIK